jgi:hypothetical protein
MSISRPHTAFRDYRTLKPDQKTILTSFKRPNSAKTDSLKKIIQIIENTLNLGAQAILVKNKSMDKFSKLKNQNDQVTRPSREKSRNSNEGLKT